MEQQEKTTTTTEPTTEPQSVGYLAALTIFTTDAKGIIEPSSARKYVADLTAGEVTDLLDEFGWEADVT